MESRQMIHDGEEFWMFLVAWMLGSESDRRLPSVTVSDSLEAGALAPVQKVRVRIDDIFKILQC